MAVLWWVDDLQYFYFEICFGLWCKHIIFLMGGGGWMNFQHVMAVLSFFSTSSWCRTQTPTCFEDGETRDSFHFVDSLHAAMNQNHILCCHRYGTPWNFEALLPENKHYHTTAVMPGQGVQILVVWIPRNFFFSKIAFYFISFIIYLFIFYLFIFFFWGGDKNAFAIVQSVLEGFAESLPNCQCPFHTCAPTYDLFFYFYVNLTPWITDAFTYSSVYFFNWTRIQALWVYFNQSFALLRNIWLHNLYFFWSYTWFCPLGNLGCFLPWK